MFSKGFLWKHGHVWSMIKDLVLIWWIYVDMMFILFKPRQVAQSGEIVGLVTWWLWVWEPVETNFLSGVFLPLTSASACEKSSLRLWKESSVSTGVRNTCKGGNTCITNRHNMTLAVKVALNPNTFNHSFRFYFQMKASKRWLSKLWKSWTGAWTSWKPFKLTEVLVIWHLAR